MALKGSLPFQLALRGGHQAEQLSSWLTPSEIDFVRLSAIQAAALSEFSVNRRLVDDEE